MKNDPINALLSELETEHLTRSPENARRLHEAIEQSYTGEDQVAVSMDELRAFIENAAEGLGILDLPPLQLGKLLKPLSGKDDLLSEMLEDTEELP